MSDKIKPQHLQRKAILYIRQSSAFQVQHNQESRRLQYAMKERLEALGWRDLEIIDDDLGCSGAGTVQRHGFERMVAEVCLGQVGAVAAREVSRFARNSREWQQLVEMCRVVDTLLIDQDTVYAPRQSNDRLLLGLKGSLNEYELDPCAPPCAPPPPSRWRNKKRAAPWPPTVTADGSGAHYLDITGEVGVFEGLVPRSAAAQAAGVMLLPGVGFDVVPSDCLAGGYATLQSGALR